MHEIADGSSIKGLEDSQRQVGISYQIVVSFKWHVYIPRVAQSNGLYLPGI